MQNPARAVKLTAFIFVASAFLAALSGCPLAEMKKDLDAITLSTPDTGKAKDGFYRGRCDTALVAAEVEIGIRQGKIVSATVIKHECGRGKKGEAVLESVVREQSVEVDAISGATASSRVILKAAERALATAAAASSGG